MTKPKPRRYWDSDCCLGWLMTDPAKAKHCKTVLDQAETDAIEIVISALVVAEVLWVRGRPRIAKDKRKKVRMFLRRPYFLVAQVDLTIAEAAQDLVWDHNIRPKDAVHVATALALGCISLDTFDEDLWKLDGKLGEGPVKLRIGAPTGTPQLSMDLEDPD